MTQRNSLAWGLKLTPAERAKVFQVADAQQLDPDALMACMAFETGERFSPTVRNGAGSGAIGLIQFMPATLRGMGYTVEQAKAMSVIEQLDLVGKYFAPYRGRLRTLADTYMAILWPKAIGWPESRALWTKAASPKTFGQNAGLDSNRDGIITKAEAAAKVQAKLVRGMRPEFRWSCGR